MSELLTAAQMRAIEQAAIESGEVTGLELMERAGQGVVEAIFEEWPELGTLDKEAGGQPPDPRSILGQKKRAVVLCGPGNNGGDGFVVARLLHERSWDVEVFLYGDVKKLPPDARVNYERWCEARVAGVGPSSFQKFLAGLTEEEQPDLWIDALLGTGLTRTVEGDIARALEGVALCLVELVFAEAGKIVAIDLPTGVCSDSGRDMMGLQPVQNVTTFHSDGSVGNEKMALPFSSLLADLTVTFHKFKCGHFLDRGPVICGRTVAKDIGL